MDMTALSRYGVTDGAASTMIEVLTPIWQRVLQLPSVGIDDNFFDLGGDSSLALELFNEIAHACGHELPPVTIYHAPTIAALAELLKQPSIPQLPALVLLKPGTQIPSVFITHGLGGSVMDFYQVIKRIQFPHAIYGMQAKGIDGVEEPFERIEDMAEFYLNAIHKVQPQGPYFLIGYSLGGLVTLEMAQRLTASGERIALLAMLDSYPHWRHLSAAQRMRLLTRLVGRHASIVRKLPIREALSYTVRASERRQHIPGDHSGEARYQSSSVSPVMRRVRESAYLALSRYRPQFYAGKIRFVRAQISTDFPADPGAVWSKLAREFEIETVPGDHLEIITTHFAHLASVLSRFVTEASVCNDPLQKQPPLAPRWS
jgi:thioesterase domain-containing protein/acyl carrier protein